MVAKPHSPVQSRLFTVADYDRLPDDRPRYELIHGELIEMPSPGWLHQLVLMAFVRFLDGFVFSRDIGTVCVAPFDVQLSDEVVQPDVFYVSAERRHITTRDRRASEAPDLVVEISSPSTKGHDREDKRELYRTHGVREHWFIDVEARAATVWTLTGDRYVELQPDIDGLIRSTVVTGFAVDMGQVFADADRQR